MVLDPARQALQVFRGEALAARGQCFNLWQESFMFVDSTALPRGPSTQAATEPAHTGKQKEIQQYCLWHLIHKCGRKDKQGGSRCNRLHACPLFEQCGSRDCPLAYHLRLMSKPQKIVPASSDRQEPRRAPARFGNGFDRRARSWSRRRSWSPRRRPETEASGRGGARSDAGNR